MTTCVYNETTPRLPGISDVGGGAKVDDAEFPPDRTIMPTSEDFNQISMLVVEHAKTQASLVIALRIVAGAPQVAAFSALGSKLLIGDFTVVDNAAGDTSITWPAGKLPPIVFGARSYCIVSDVAAAARIVPITNGVRVKTYDMAATLIDADINFDLS